MEFPTYAAAAAWANGSKGYRTLAICERLIDTPGVDETDPTILVLLGRATPRTAYQLLETEESYDPEPVQDDKVPSKKVKKAKRKQVTG